MTMFFNSRLHFLASHHQLRSVKRWERDKIGPLKISRKFCTSTKINQPGSRRDSNLTMLRRTMFLLFGLVLLSVEIRGAVQKKVAQDTARSISEVDLQNAFGGNYGGGGGQYMSVGADGSAAAYLKIDLSVFMERLNMIPNMGNTINLLIQKIDQLTMAVIGQGSPSGSVYERILTLEKVIIGRIGQQEGRINSIIQLLQTLQSEVASISQGMAQIIATIQQLIGGGGGADACIQQSRIIERLIQQVLAILAQLPGQIETIFQGPGNMGPTILQSVQQFETILQQSIQLIQRLDGRLGDGFGTCSSLQAGQAQISQTLQSLFALIEQIPRQIQQIIIDNNSGKQLLGYVMELGKLCQTILAEIETVKGLILKRTLELEKHITAQSQEMVIVKRIVGSQSEVLQSSAKAAMMASRALKCPTSNDQKDKSENPLNDTVPSTP